LSHFSEKGTCKLGVSLNVLYRRANSFHTGKTGKCTELIYIYKKKFSRWSNQVRKIILTASQFAPLLSLK